MKITGLARSPYGEREIKEKKQCILPSFRQNSENTTFPCFVKMGKLGGNPGGVLVVLPVLTSLLMTVRKVSNIGVDGYVRYGLYLRKPGEPQFCPQTRAVRDRCSSVDQYTW